MGRWKRYYRENGKDTISRFLTLYYVKKLIGEVWETLRKNQQRWIITFLAEFFINLHSARIF